MVHLLQILALCLAAPACRPGQVSEPVIVVDMLDNGSWTESAGDAVDEHGLHPIPWWRS
ncbi:MAG: hypothetical protein IPJ19_21515 [Planctomycetes bacterium]|nr:hypothetical protein [Planctomycetota bacterium]